MTLELIVVHVLFVAACAYFSWRSGRAHGSTTTVEAFLERGMITEAQLDREFGND